jgi:hypothetical protein
MHKRLNYPPILFKHYLKLVSESALIIFSKNNC